MCRKILIIDGHNYLFRAFYGVPLSATTQRGTLVNAVYGFMAFIRKAIETVEPEELLIVFDSETGIVEKKLNYPGYKAQRLEYDTRIFEQLNIIKEILMETGTPFLEHPKLEADDVIGSLALFFSKKGYQVNISSNDLDFMQLVSSTVFVIRNAKGKVEHFDVLRVKDKFGIFPYQYLDYLVLKGDKSDNIEGVLGIGSQTAIKLINNYSNLEALLNNLSNLSARDRTRLLCKKEYLLQMKSFLRISTEIDHNLLHVPPDLRCHRDLLLISTNDLLKITRKGY